MPVVVVDAGRLIDIDQSVDVVVEKLVRALRLFTGDRSEQVPVVTRAFDVFPGDAVHNDRSQRGSGRSAEGRRVNRLRIGGGFRPWGLRQRRGLATGQFHHRPPERVAGEHVGLGIAVVMVILVFRRLVDLAPEIAGVHGGHVAGEFRVLLRIGNRHLGRPDLLELVGHVDGRGSRWSPRPRASSAP